jgi:molecular chaperone GrpE (heat shock protein)
MNEENNQEKPNEEVIDEIKNPLQEKLDDLTEKNAKLNQTCIALSQTLDMTRMRAKSLESEIQNTVLQEKLKMARLVIKTLDLLESAERNIHNIEEVMQNSEDEELVLQIRNLFSGLMMGRNDILHSIKEQKIEKFECKVGDEISPELNVVEVIKDNEAKPNTIFEIKSTGYFLTQGERKVVIRAPEVSVACTTE